MRLITLFKRELWAIEQRSAELAEALRATTRARLENQVDADPALPTA